MAVRPEFTVVTDSAACIPAPLRDEFGIITVPISFQLDGMAYRDDKSLPKEEFYRRLQRTTQRPSTSAASPGDFLDAFRKAAGTCKRIVCITIGSNFSANYGSALTAIEMAREELPGLEVQAVDSGSAGMAEGFVAVAAARSRSVGEALRSAEAVAPRTYLIGVLETLDYVAKSGRVPRVVAWASSILQIKPIFEYHGGTVSPLERVRTRARSLERLLVLAEQRVRSDKTLHMAIIHAHAEAEAEELLHQAKERLRPEELMISEFSQAMAIHTGRGLIGLAFYNDE